MRLSARLETWPIRGVFRIARGEVREAHCLVVEVTDGALTGRGEAAPEPDLGTDGPASLALVEGLAGAVAAGLTREALLGLLPSCPARNALDCALWDLEAKRSGRGAAAMVGLAPQRPVTTVYTLSLDEPAAMARAAAKARHMPVLKIKLGQERAAERVAAVRAAAPDSRLVVDANESWPPERLEALLQEMAGLGVAMVEQPLPRGADAALASIRRPLPVCADESCATLADLPHLVGRYDLVNIKLDKTGGLTEALALAQQARAAGLKVMVGCMVGTSLAMAPAHLLAQLAEVVDIDGPLLLARDRDPGLRYDGALVQPPSPALWG